MLARIKAVFLEWESRADDSSGRHNADDLHLAAAALMIEAARLDGHFEAEERTRIEVLLQQRFSLSQEDLSSLVEAATSMVDDAVELYGFTHELVKQLNHEERIEVMEMLWEVAYADGDLHPFEANLLRRVAGLLYVTDQESGAARARVLERAVSDGENYVP